MLAACLQGREEVIRDDFVWFGRWWIFIRGAVAQHAFREKSTWSLRKIRERKNIREEWPFPDKGFLINNHICVYNIYIYYIYTLYIYIIYIYIHYIYIIYIWNAMTYPSPSDFDFCQKVSLGCHPTFWSASIRQGDVILLAGHKAPVVPGQSWRITWPQRAWNHHTLPYSWYITVCKCM